jgi:ABC-type multidrug transport system fused ATPase/permease subunit
MDNHVIDQSAADPAEQRISARATSCRRYTSTAPRWRSRRKPSGSWRPTRGRPVLALDNVSLAVGDREFVALLGPSGCSKSTLLYLVSGFLPVDAGVIQVEDRSVVKLGPDRGIVFPHFALFSWKTVVLYGLEKRGLPRDERCRGPRLHRAGGARRV